MLHDGDAYRIYSMQYGSNDRLFQGSWNAGAARYEYGHRSIPQLDLVGFPGNSPHGRPAMLHDGGNYRFYFQVP